MKAYQEDLAYIHDVSSTHSQQAAPGLLRIMREQGIDEGLVVDLGCGSGHWARRLVDAGYQVVGVDCSRHFIDLAKTRVPEAKFVKQSFLKARIPRCDAVTALGEVFNYRFDQSNSISALRGLFQRVYDALRPGGLIVFDVAESGRHPQPVNRHYGGTDWFCLLNTVEQGRTITRKITSLRKIGTTYRRSDEVHRLHLFQGSELASVLRQIGFRVRTTRSYGDYPFGKVFNACVGIIARKPATS